MQVNYNPEFDGESIGKHNCVSITGYEMEALLSFTGIQGYSNNYSYEISGRYPIMRIYVSHPEYEMQRTIYFDESRVKNDFLDVKKTGQGIGLQIFAAQVDSLTANGFKNIRVHALGGEGCEAYNGHITWAKFGFTMDTGNEILKFRELVKANGRTENTLNELLQSSEGEKIWEENGFSWNGIFILEKNSENQKLLRNYLDACN